MSPSPLPPPDLDLHSQLGFASENSAENEWEGRQELPSGGFMDDLWVFEKRLLNGASDPENYAVNVEQAPLDSRDIGQWFQVGANRIMKLYACSLVFSSSFFSSPPCPCCCHHYNETQLYFFPTHMHTLPPTASLWPPKPTRSPTAVPGGRRRIQSRGHEWRRGDGREFVLHEPGGHLSNAHDSLPNELRTCCST